MLKILSIIKIATKSKDTFYIIFVLDRGNEYQMTNLDLSTEIKLMDSLEDFVLKKIKFPYGDLTERNNYFWSLTGDKENAPEPYKYEITESDKQHIYNSHAEGEYKETEQQRTRRESPIQLASLSNEPVEIPEIDRLPRYYDDILTAIKNFQTYVQSQSSNTVDKNTFKQAQKLRKKAFHIYSLHNDCRTLESVPPEIYINFERLRSGRQQVLTANIIKQAYVEYVAQTLNDEQKRKKISNITTAYIIDDLRREAIPSVKQALIDAYTTRINEIQIYRSRLNIHREKAIILPSYIDNGASIPLSKKEIAFFEKENNRLDARIKDYEDRIKVLTGGKKATRTSHKKRKYQIQNNECLKQKKIGDDSLYDLIKKIAKENRG